MIVAQLVERSLPIPEIHGLNPDIGKILSTNCPIEKMKIKKKRPGLAHLKKPMTTTKPALFVLGKRTSLASIELEDTAKLVQLLIKHYFSPY